MLKSKNVVKKLTTILFTLVAIFSVGLTNVNAETTTVDVEDRAALIDAMDDKTTDIVRLNKNIELSSEYNTTFSIEKSKTLDLNGHTITVPDGKEINFWYYANADIKIMNSSNSSSAKIIGNHTGSSTYFLLRGAIIRDAEKVNFEIDGVDFEVKNSNFTTIVFMKNGQNYENLIIKNSNVNGNQYLFWSGAAKKVYLENIILNRAEGADRNLYRQLSNTSSLTVNDVIDANAVVEYYPSSGVKATADRTTILNTSDLNAYWGPITVKFADGTPVVHTITFNSNGGTSVASQNIKAGEKLTKPTPAPTKDGFTFDGWYEDSTFSKEFDFNTPITSDMNLYAKWKAANSINEIRLVGDVQYGNVPAGILPSFNPRTTTDSITINKMNSSWEYKMESGGWSGFGLETPVAYNDGKTNYGYDFCVKTNDGYQLDYSNLKVFYNDVEVTSSVRVLKYAWGAYVTVDLGKAIGENPTTHTVTFNSNGGSEIAPKEVVSGLKIKAPDTPTKDKYLFRGWYEDDTFSIPFDFNNTPITSDMTLYAKWEAAYSINEIRLVGDIQYGNVLVGTLPSFNPRTTTDSITIDKTNSYWSYKMQNGLWSGFGLETPTAVNDGKTEYGYTFNVKPSDGYQLASDLKVIYNDEDVTSTVKVTKYSWGAYVDVNLGKANGTPVVYTVTFNSNDGTSVASQNVNAGEKLEEPTPAPTKEGFTFDGWYEDLTSSKKFDFNTPITDSMTLYAKWIENKYTVTFDANGGSGEMTPATDLTGEYTLPENEFTAPDGKKFKGWSLTKDGEIVTKVTMDKDIKVYAIWEAIPVTTYTVTFDANGGSGEMTSVTDLTGEYTLPENGFTAPDGKKFKGWSLTKDGEIVTKVTMDKDVKVYAIWEAIPVTTYTVTFDANGGSGEMTSVTDLTGEYTLPENGFTAPDGKKFKGWSLTKDGEIVTKVTMDKDVKVYAIWEAIPVTTYTVTFDANGGTGSMTAKTGLTGEYDLPENGFTAPDGKKFKGWSLTTDGEIVTKVTMDKDIKVYAIWEAIPVTTYTLTFDANGGTGSMTAKTGLTGEYTLPSNGFTAPSGKKFKGWSLTTDGAIVTKVDMTENKTVYAIWENIIYTVTFNSNGGTSVASQNVNAGEKLTEPTPAPTKAGFTFDGWYEDATLNTKFDFNTSVVSNLNLYAKWTENKYTLTFEANGGTGSMTAKTGLTGEHTLPANGFTAPSGKQFKGWSLTTDGEIVTKVTMDKDVKVYAIWEAIPVTTYTVTFDANGGSGEMTAKTGLTGEYTLPSNGFTAPSGKQFKGWSLTTDGAIVTKVDMTENKTVYAIWEAIPVTTYTVTFDANGGSGEMTAKTGLTGEYTLPANGFTAPSGKQFKGWSLTTDGAIVTKVDMTENKTVYAIWKDIIYSYEFLESTGEQTIDGKANSFKIVIDADETKFVSLEIDGVLYEKDVDYTVKHGSTIIEFTSTGLAKLNALSKGEHNVTVTFTDEVINGKITVNAVNPPIIPQNPDIDNPQTYDGIFTYITMFVVSILGLITAVIIGKKRTRTN